MKFFWLLIPAFLLSLAGEASAGTVEKRAALASRTRVSVAPGIGHTIDFSGTGERVYRAWIGDGGQRLQILGGAPLEEGTPVVNLRRFIPQGNSGFEAVDETVVTLTTQEESGQLNVYEFIVRYSDRGDSLTRIVDTPISESTALPGQRTNISLEVGNVRNGLATFNLEEDSLLTAKVEAWARLVEDGTAHRQAAQSVAVDFALLERLNQIGLRSALVGGVDL